MYSLKVYLAFQAKELYEHKYYLSQKAGYDVGMKATIADWIETGHAQRFHDAFLEHQDDLEKICNPYCGTIENCKGMDCCPLQNGTVHAFLHD
ncbi:MAG: DUF4032 domain-containing protein [archaeon]